MNENENNQPLRTLSRTAIWFSGIQMAYLFGSLFFLAFVYIYLGLKAVGCVDRVYERLNYGRRDLFGFGFLYFLIYGLMWMVNFLFSIGSSRNDWFLPASVLNLGCVGFALFMWVVTTAVEHSIIYVFEEVLARWFGIQFSTKDASLAESQAAENYYRWANRDRKTGKLAPPRKNEDASKGYYPGEPPYTTFKPPLSWGYFCTKCGARTKDYDENRCWYCNEYGRQYHYYMENPKVIHEKMNDYNPVPYSNEPEYKNWQPPLEWSYCCMLCGARCPNAHDRCWYCEEKGLIWGQSNALKCPSNKKPAEPDHARKGRPPENGNGDRTVPFKPRR